MRNLLDDSTASRSAAAEREAAIALAQQMESEVAILLENIDMLTAPTSPYTTYTTYSAYNSPDDKIIMCP